MKLGLGLGLLVAFAIACGGASKSAQMKPEAVPPPGGGGIPGDPRAEIDRLDGEITATMQKLGEARPDPAADACVDNCEPKAMSGAATTATAQDPTCRPASSTTCTESCNLKSSICTNAAKICEIAGKLGGADSYANDKCNRGTSSCDAAKKRCCNCT